MSRVASHADDELRIPRGFCRVGNSPGRRRTDVRAWRVAGVRRAGVGGDQRRRESLASGLGRGGAAGPEGLRARRACKPRRGAEELGTVERALLTDPVAHGFSTELSMSPRVAAAIQRVTGVDHHPGQVWRALQKLRWSRQCPARRARERDEAAIAEWKTKRWAQLKETPGAAAPGSSSKTRAASYSKPVVRRTSAPRGQTPILRHTRGDWKRLSVAGALALRWDEGDVRFFFPTLAATYTDTRLVTFLRALKRHFRCQRVLLI